MKKQSSFNSFNRQIITPQITSLINQLKAKHQENGEITEEMIGLMKDLRALYVSLSQPTIVKSIRLVYEHIQENGSFSIGTWEEEDDQVSSFEYFLDLLRNPTNKYNRDEIKELNLYLKQGPQPQEDVKEEE